MRQGAEVLGEAMSQQTTREDLRARFPDRARTRGGAIILFCVECCGGERAEARRCAERSCFLWPFGPAGRFERLKAKQADGSTPDPEDVAEMFADDETEEQGGEDGEASTDARQVGF